MTDMQISIIKIRLKKKLKKIKINFFLVIVPIAMNAHKKQIVKKEFC